MPPINPINTYRYKVFNITILKIVRTRYYTCFVFLKFFKIFKHEFKKLSWHRFLLKLTYYKENLLYMDHFLGGGTTIYSERKIKELAKNNNVVVCQYDSFLNKYIFSNNVGKMCFIIKNFPAYIFENFQKIIINNLVGYKNILSVLNIITKAKNKYQKLTIDFMVHDFYCICQTVHLIKPDLTTCACKSNVVCTQCQHNVSAWRNTWQIFLTNIVDSITVFSNSSKQILLSVYPNLSSKIKIIPHTIPKMRKVKIKKHRDINIAVIGGLYSIKGKELVCEMLSYLPKHVNIINIGQIDGIPPKHPQFKCTGMYDLQSLPTIVEKHQIDIAFIASIVPETFSFTTSECIQMGLPVACFDIGAPAERVSKYNKGLVISKITPNIALNEILSFVKKITKKADK